jgi:hypothetical protein
LIKAKAWTVYVGYYILQRSSLPHAYNTSSDERLKENITDALSSVTIDAIKVRSFDWKADGSHQDYGMVAQELEAVAPEAVTRDESLTMMMGQLTTANLYQC